MNKQTFLLPAIRLTAVYSILHILPRELEILKDMIFANAAKHNADLLVLYHFGLLIAALIFILIFAINPGLMGFKFETTDKKRSQVIFEIGMLIIGVFFTFSALMNLISREGIYNFFLYPITMILIIVYLLIAIRAKFVIPKLI